MVSWPDLAGGPASVLDDAPSATATDVRPGDTMEQLQPVRPVTVFQAVFEQLSALLAGATFAPGARLPAERELAEQLHVSRPSVREALKALRVLGLVEVRGRSTYVKAPAPARPLEAPPLALPVAEAERRELHEFRE